MSTDKTKNVKFQIRIDEGLRDDFHTAAELQGLRAASLLHQFIVKTVQEAKRQYPDEFKKIEASEKDAPVSAHTLPRVTSAKEAIPQGAKNKG